MALDNPPFKASKRLSGSPKCHKTYYFPDGNVILQLRDVQFRVHLSQLSRKSSCFEALFETREIENSNEVHRTYISDDDPLDFEALLCCIYDGMQLLEVNTVNFKFLASVVRSATRYEFHAIRDWAITRLEKLFPSNLELFNPREGLTQSPVAILLARQCNVNQILKPAFYRMVRARRFCSLNRADENPPSYDVEEYATAEGLLSKADIIIGSRLFREFTTTWLKIATTVPSPRCSDQRSKCVQMFIYHWWSRVVKVPGIFQQGAFDPLGSLDKLIAMDWVADGVCPECLAGERATWKRMKMKLWEDMDEWIRPDAVSRASPSSLVMQPGLNRTMLSTKLELPDIPLLSRENGADESNGSGRVPNGVSHLNGKHNNSLVDLTTESEDMDESD